MSLWCPMLIMGYEVIFYCLIDLALLGMHQSRILNLLSIKAYTLLFFQQSLTIDQGDRQWEWTLVCQCANVYFFKKSQDNKSIG